MATYNAWIRGPGGLRHPGLVTRPIGDVDPTFVYGQDKPTAANTYAHFGTNPTLKLEPGTGGLLTIVAPGVYENRDYTSYVTVNASSATPDNPIILRANRFRGGNLGTGTARFLVRVQNCAQIGAVIIERNLFDPDFEFDQLEAIRAGGNVIVRRNTIRHVIDGITCLFGRNQIWGNLIEEGRVLPTTTQPDGITHTDGIILAGGDGDDLFGNVVTGWRNAAIWARAAAVATYGGITNARIRNNWVSGAVGAVLHVYKQAADPTVSVSITGNEVDSTGATAGIYVGSTVTATITGNTNPDGSPATVTRPNMG